jgi:hypothetical protein
MFHYANSGRMLLRVLFSYKGKTRIFFDGAPISLLPLFYRVVSPKEHVKNIFQMANGFAKDVKIRFRHASDIL